MNIPKNQPVKEYAFRGQAHNGYIRLVVDGPAGIRPTDVWELGFGAVTENVAASSPQTDGAVFWIDRATGGTEFDPDVHFFFLVTKVAMVKPRLRRATTAIQKWNVG